MKIKTKIYKDVTRKGDLHFVGKGECEVYEPEIRGESDIVKPHITLSFGDYRLHLDRIDFIRFVGKMITDKAGERNVFILRQTK